MNKYFAVTPRYMEDLAAKEAEQLGATQVKLTHGGVSFEGDLAVAYRFCLWTRVSSRVLLQLEEFEADDEDSYYTQLSQIAWEELFTVDDGFLCNLTASGQGPFSDRFGLLKLKDAIVDRFRDKTGNRPSVDRENPTVRIEGHRSRNRYTIYFDLSGQSLHRRGYRTDKGSAALRENTAAAMLYRCGWDKPTDRPFLDPMCGSGTLCIEAAMIASDHPPSLERTGWGFRGWKGHKEDLWEEIRQEGKERYEIGLTTMGAILGYDKDSSVVRMARANFNRSGMKGVRFDNIAVEKLKIPSYLAEQNGLIATNPPYGIRLEERVGLESLYKSLGNFFADQLPQWTLTIITPDRELGMAVKLRSFKNNKIDNGGLPCLLLHFQNPQENILRDSLSQSAEQFQNRLKKNLKRLRKWARKNEVTSYRLYDADLPDYNFAIDWYEGQWVNFQEYAPTVQIEQAKAEKRVREALIIIANLLEIEKSAIFVKTRRRQRGADQYEKRTAPTLSSQEKRDKRQEKNMIAHEGECSFMLNMSDYIDTGLFLDHRPMRHWIRENAKGKDFLNLFAYTGSATVHAAAGGAKSTATVDGSKTYVNWAEDNLLYNKLYNDSHKFYVADCFKWLEDSKDDFDLIFLDPPTFSNSKSQRTTFDIQSDHVRLIVQSLKHLRPGGTLIFSNNFKKFKMEFNQKQYKIEDVSSWSVPEDFKGSKGIHHCWLISYLDI